MTPLGIRFWDVWLPPSWEPSKGRGPHPGGMLQGALGPGSVWLLERTRPRTCAPERTLPQDVSATCPSKAPSRKSSVTHCLTHSAPAVHRPPLRCSSALTEESGPFRAPSPQPTLPARRPVHPWLISLPEWVGASRTSADAYRTSRNAYSSERCSVMGVQTGHVRPTEQTPTALRGEPCPHMGPWAGFCHWR